MTRAELEAIKARHEHCRSTMDEGDIWSCACDVPPLVAEGERLTLGVRDAIRLIDGEMRVPSAEAWVFRLHECRKKLEQLVNDNE